jgi:hypothetical protein
MQQPVSCPSRLREKHLLFLLPSDVLCLLYLLYVPTQPGDRSSDLIGDGSPFALPGRQEPARVKYS